MARPHTNTAATRSPLRPTALAIAIRAALRDMVRDELLRRG